MNTSINQQFSEVERIEGMCHSAAILGRQGMSKKNALRYVYSGQRQGRDETPATQRAVEYAYSVGVAMRARAERKRGIWARVRNWLKGA